MNDYVIFWFLLFIHLSVATTCYIMFYRFWNKRRNPEATKFDLALLFITLTIVCLIPVVNVLAVYEEISDYERNFNKE